MFRYVVVLLGLIFLWPLAEPSSAHSEAIKVGVILPLTGKLGKLRRHGTKIFCPGCSGHQHAGRRERETARALRRRYGGKPPSGRAMLVQRLVSENQVATIVGGCIQFRGLGRGNLMPNA